MRLPFSVRQPVLRLFIAASVVFGAGSLPVSGQAPPTIPTIDSRVAGLRPIPGFMPMYWDELRGRLLLEISRFDTECLYQVSLPGGLGSNPVGLDRGQLGASWVVRFERTGPRVLLTAVNYKYRALTTNASERQAVTESFAPAVLWGFPIDATQDGRVLVDATAFFLRDAHGVSARLRDTEQGHYRLDDSRSAVYLPRTRGFPKNTEVEATLTFTTDEKPGDLVAQVAADAQAVTVREHHSFVELPDGDYHPRTFDPRVGNLTVDFLDFAAPITSPLERRWILRHRLRKTDPTVARSTAVEPIVYYVDSGAPEPIRQALVDGASWWNRAFEAAGFIDAFQVRVLPADIDPMDVRYNVIHWVHRSTRGWSYGDSVIDPRTGEILKGNVLLGSQRIRQDVLIGSSLTSPFARSDAAAGPLDPQDLCNADAIPDAGYLADADPAADAAALSLARIRQLAAHEVGHALGFEHNFAASTYGRASVMDYPAPLATLNGDRVDLSQAYATSIGKYDELIVRYAYSEFAPGTDEGAALSGIVRQGLADHLLYIDDDDGRPLGAGHPLASLWDNGDDAPAMLRQQLAVRRAALDRFGLASLPNGQPLSLLEARLVPLYLHHRFQLQAAMKWIGGLYFTYAVKEQGQPAPTDVRRVVPGADQRRALTGVLDTLDPTVLTLPQRILDLIPPPASGYTFGTAELFPRATSPAFDPVSAAVVAADLAISGLLQPARAARLERFHAERAADPGFQEVVTALVDRVWARGVTSTAAARETGLREAVIEGVQTLLVSRLMDLSARTDADPAVRHIASAGLRRLSATLAGRTDAHAAGTRADIERFLARPDQPRKKTTPPAAPPGEPIG